MGLGKLIHKTIKKEIKGLIGGDSKSQAESAPGGPNITPRDLIDAYERGKMSGQPPMGCSPHAMGAVCRASHSAAHYMGFVDGYNTARMMG